jgi:hypothetical protein
MPTDDELYRVDDVFLGPPGVTLPFRARYRSLGIGALVAAVIIGIEVRLHAVNAILVIWALFLAYVAATLAGRYIDYERTVRSTLKALAHEVTAPRPRRRTTTVYRPAPPSHRRHARS